MTASIGVSPSPSPFVRSSCVTLLIVMVALFGVSNAQDMHLNHLVIGRPEHGHIGMRIGHIGRLFQLRIFTAT